MASKSIIAFLIINKLELLPEIAIKSVLSSTDSDVAIGYLDKSDLPDIASNPRITLVKLEPTQDLSEVFGISSSKYLSFSSDNFFKLVQLKWVLFELLFEMGFDYLIYSDSDVVWVGNPVPELIARFESDNQVHFQIQNFTTSPNVPRLCMGFVAMRNSDLTKEFVHECKVHHAISLREEPRTGDDDVVTSLYIKKNRPQFLVELPQSTFPTGNMINLFSKRMDFPGLASPTPYIFHANFVVGLKNKLKLVQLFGNSKIGFKLGVALTPKTRVHFLLLRIKLWVYSLKSYF